MATTTLAGVPAAPTGLKARAVAAAARMRLNSTGPRPTRGSAPIENYKIETSADKGATWSDSVPLTEAENTASGVQTYHAVDAIRQESTSTGCRH